MTTATEGNHGRSVAWGASLFHCRCVVYVPQTCSRSRELAIARYGAEVIRSSGNYDETVHQCARDAERNEWSLVSDTSWEGYRRIPRLIMQGYTVMTAEVAEYLGATEPTHIFVQGGVGGLAGAVCAHACDLWGRRRPQFIVVEPSGAACLFASAIAGKATAIPAAHTIMAGLECGEASLVAWELLTRAADFFMTVPDSAVPDCMRMLAFPRDGDPPIVAGESAVAGLAGLLYALENAETRSELGLDAKSNVLLFGTESDTDPELYSRLIGT